MDRRKCIECGKVLNIHSARRETKRCHSCSKKGSRNPMSLATNRSKVSSAKKGSVPWNKGISGYSTSWKGRKHSSLARKHMSRSHWSKSHPKEFEEKVIKGALLKVGIHPNEFEKRSKKLLPKTFEYSGSGQELINGRSPDYIDRKNRVVVLCNGCYWHLTKNGLPISEKSKLIREKLERKPFIKAGYDVWFIWEDNNVVKKYKH